jgi:hypothetical protein
VQVQESLYLCHLSGLDPKTWADAGWIDYLIQCDFNCTSPNIPVGEFADFLKDSPCTHHVRMGNMMGGAYDGKPYFPERKIRYTKFRGYAGLVLTPEEACGAAANAYGFGADGIGLWNICCNMGERNPEEYYTPDRRSYRDAFFEWINAVSSPDKVFARPRRYHYFPLYKKRSLKMRNYPVNSIVASPTGSPAQIVTFWPQGRGCRQIYRFLMADGRDGRKLRGTLAFRMLNSTMEDSFQIDINGRIVDPAHIRREFVPDEELPAVWYRIDLENCPSFDGDNELGMTMKEMKDRPVKQESPYGMYPYMEELDVAVLP